MNREHIMIEINNIREKIMNIIQTIYEYIDACGYTNVNWDILDSLYTDILNNYVDQGMILESQL